MYPLELIQSVRLITDVCLEISPGEDVLCTADGEERMDVMTLIAAECRAEAPIAPVEDSVEGVAVVDGTMVGEPTIEGFIGEPFKVTFERGGGARSPRGEMRAS
jgi:leucyl aminopeptidase (aminopeptidase T)